MPNPLPALPPSIFIGSAPGQGLGATANPSMASMLYDPAALDRERTRDLMGGLATGFLQAGAPSRLPIDLGTAFGNALQNGQQATAGSDERTLRRAMAVAQIHQLDAVNKVLPGLIAGAANPPPSGVPASGAVPAPASAPGQTAQPPAPDFGSQVASGESGGNYAAANPQSGAYGKYQFTPDTWSTVASKNPQLGLPFDMRQATPQQQEQAFSTLTAMNGQGLRTLGIQPTPGNLYLAHRFGPQGASTFLQAQDNTPIAQVFPAQWIAQNPDLQNKTVGQFKADVAGRFGSSGPQMPGAPPDPSRWAALSLLPQFAPFARAMMQRDQLAYQDAWKRYGANQDLLKNQSAMANQAVNPDGSINQPVINAGAAKAAAEGQASGRTANLAVNPDGTINQPVIDAAAAKKKAEESAALEGHMESVLPKGFENMTPDQIRPKMNPLIMKTIDQLGQNKAFLSQIPARGGSQYGASRTELQAATEMFYPGWTPMKNASAENTFNYYQPAADGGKVLNSISASAQHLSDAAEAYNELHNGRIPWGNRFFNEIATQRGWGKEIGYQTVLNAIGPEIARVISNGSDNTLSEREAQKEVSASWNSPEQMSEMFRRDAGMIQKRLNTHYTTASVGGLDKSFIDERIGKEGMAALQSLPTAIKVGPQGAPGAVPAPPAGFRVIQ